MPFVPATLTPTDHWRAVILHGRNVASYKFALAKALLELAEAEHSFVRLDELAVPFSRHLADHLERVDKQATSASSRFLDACRAFNAGTLDQASLIDATVKLGFNNVIDAFHIVHGAEVGVRFFLDERSGGGIRLTDTLYNLKGRAQWENLEAEVEARWRLVETAWDLNMPRYALTVEHETDTGLLVPDRKRYARRTITGSREALSGYQKGTCFYCFADLSLKGDTRAEVDHFFPHKLKPCGVARSLDGVWNLVLACWSCNAGPGGKFDRLPHVRYLERLHDRNEYLIGSHHPLRETLIKQTGATEDKRRAKLQRDYTAVQAILITTWQAPYENAPTF